MARYADYRLVPCANPNCSALVRVTAKQLTYVASPVVCSLACFKAVRPDQEVGLPEERVCEACGRTFLVGGRGRPMKSETLCSAECQRSSRFRAGTIAKSLSVPEAAYLAGFIDGEGSIMLVQRSHGLGGHLRLSITNTDKEVLDWVVEVAGVGAVNRHRDEGETNRATWLYRANGDAAASIIEQIRPYLRVKSAQADLGLEAHSRLRTPSLKADTSWQVEYMERMKAMNRRGGRKYRQPPAVACIS